MELYLLQKQIAIGWCIPCQDLKAATTLCYLSSNSGIMGWLNYMCSGTLSVSDPAGHRQGSLGLLSPGGPLVFWRTRSLLKLDSSCSAEEPCVCWRIWDRTLTPHLFLCGADTDFPQCSRPFCPARAGTVVLRQPQRAKRPAEPRPAGHSARSAAAPAARAQRLFVKHPYWGSLSPHCNSPQVTLQGKSHRSDYLGNSAFMLLIQYPL